MSICVYLWMMFFVFFSTACSELEKPKPEPFFAGTAPPAKREFRWSNGRTPKTLDPAFAAAPPETDLVRALYEGLSDTDPKTLAAVPAVAAEWKSSEDFKTWTFRLRSDARWSNGERVTADDFVRSWKRLADLGDKVPLRKLLKNIVGMDTENFVTVVADEPAAVTAAPANGAEKTGRPTADSPAPPETSAKTPPAAENEKKKSKNFGVEALDDQTLKVTLVEPDRDFPALVAHPVFRPVYRDQAPLEEGKLNANVVTNGAFRLASVGPDGITLDRAEHFWAKDRIELERVRFVPKDSAEKALEAYRAGEVDAVTNAEFAPLALKLLTPYSDFQRTTHSALNFYEINRRKKPFDDRRVREALAIAIERERLTEGEMEGATRPARSLLPFDESREKQFAEDKERARALLAEAGFGDGENFPVVRLVINRNDVQQRVAKAIVKMWKQTLNIDTVIIAKEPAELDAVREAGEFDLLRRGAVFPTADETAAMNAILAPKKIPAIEDLPPALAAETLAPPATAETLAAPETEEKPPVEKDDPEQPAPAEIYLPEPEFLTVERAIGEFPVIPLYFPTSYSLVKPYIQGFSINTLDAPSLKEVKIDINWQPKKPNGES